MSENLPAAPSPDDVDFDLRPSDMDVSAYLALPETIEWERLPDETDKAWAAFVYYRDMGPSRTQVAIKAKGGLSFSHTWPTKYLWTVRVRAFDSYTASILETEYIEATKETARRHAEAASSALEALMAPINALQQQIEEDPDRVMDRLKQEDPTKLIKMIQGSARVLQPVMSAERLAQGLPTEFTKTEIDSTERVNNAEPDRLATLIGALVGTSVLDALVGTGRAGENADPPYYEVHPDQPAPEAGSLPAGTS